MCTELLCSVMPVTMMVPVHADAATLSCRNAADVQSCTRELLRMLAEQFIANKGINRHLLACVAEVGQE